MREIKFRAWHETDKCWYNPRFIEMNLLGQAILHQGLEQFEIIPASAIEQYTGLKDKNGKEIYEGDIVQIYIGGATYEVAWMEKDGGWFCFSNNDDHYEPLYHADFEVIGNIHENPELLGEEE